MTAKWITIAITASLLLCAVSAAAQEPPDKAALASQIAEGRKQNQMALLQYSWNMRTEVKMDGEVKSLKVDLVRFTPEGEMQKTKISDSADGQKTPRGVRGKVAKKKIKGMQEWVQDLTQLLKKYSLPTTGNLVDFMEKATVEPQGQMATVVGSNVVQQGDKMTILVDTASRQMKMVEIATSLDGDEVTVEILNEVLENGPSYTARQLVKVPAKKVELTIENFNHQKQ